MKVSREHIYEFGELRLDCIEDKPQGAIIHFTGLKTLNKRNNYTLELFKGDFK